MIDFLDGKAEAEAFENKEYAKLSRSTNRKIQIMMGIFNLLVDGKLKTNAKIRDIYGFSIQALFEFFKEKWYVALILYLLPIIIGVLCGVLI